MNIIQATRLLNLSQSVQTVFVMLLISTAILVGALTLSNSQAFGHIRSHNLPKSETLNQGLRGPEGFVRLTKPVPPPNFEGFPVHDTQSPFKCATPHTSGQSGIHLHSGTPDEDLRWTDGIFFQLDITYNESDVFLILSAVYELSEVVCIPFFLWYPTVKPVGDYVFVNNTVLDDGTCDSNLGRIRGRQLMHLGSATCMEFGIIQHEFIHALGFLHEQCRPDRDDYVIINWDNIMPGYEYEFRKYDDFLTFDVPYDFDSVMHYDGYEFTRNNKSTIINKETKLPTKRNHEMSPYDILKLRRMYNCDDYEYESTAN